MSLESIGSMAAWDKLPVQSGNDTALSAASRFRQTRIKTSRAVQICAIPPVQTTNMSPYDGTFRDRARSLHIKIAGFIRARLHEPLVVLKAIVHI